MLLHRRVHKALTKPLKTKQCKKKKKKKKYRGAIQSQRNTKMWQESSRIMQPQWIQPTLFYHTWSDYLLKTGGSFKTRGQSPSNSLSCKNHCLAAITAWTETHPPTHLQKWPLQNWVEEHWQDNVGKLALLLPLLYLSCGEIEDLISSAVSQHVPHYKWRKRETNTFWGVVKNPHFLLKHLGYFHIFCGAPFVCLDCKLDSLVHELMLLLPVT